jgi:hypothetical protein
MSQIFGETRTPVSRTERSTAIAEARPVIPVGVNSSFAEFRLAVA